MTTKKVIKFPETNEIRLKRIIDYHEELIAKYERDIKRSNWFGYGFVSGITLSFCITCLVFYFV